MWKRFIKLMMKFVMIVLVLGLISFTIPRIVTGLYSRSRTYSENDVPSRRAVIVFGAGLWRDGSPTPVLRDRVITAVNLYLAGKVEKILMSGDNRVAEYNEPIAMRDLALSLGVPEDDIVLDYAGRRTYDTCYRAKEIFGLTEAIMVTQSFHITRALYTCNQLGIDTLGVSANNQIFRKSSLIYWNLRESLATMAAMWDLHIHHPIPVLGDPEPIFPE